jgi:hypothetical protein
LTSISDQSVPTFSRIVHPPYREEAGTGILALVFSTKFLEYSIRHREEAGTGFLAFSNISRIFYPSFRGSWRTDIFSFLAEYFLSIYLYIF